MSDLAIRKLCGQKHAQALLGVGVALLMSTASAQYAFESVDQDELDGVRYFGSAKDEKGALLSDVTFRIESDRAAFMFISDAEGRFRGMLPIDIPLKSVTPACFKEGHEAVRVTKRPGPKTAKHSSVQVDCIMRKAAAT